MKLEALLFAMARLFGWPQVADSIAFRLQNPLLLKSYAKIGKHETDENGLRKFSSALGGVKSSLFDLEIKVKGQSRAGLSPDDPLRDLLRIYGLGEQQAVDEVIAFIQVALNDPSLNELTPVSYFIEEK